MKGFEELMKGMLREALDDNEGAERAFAPKFNEQQCFAHMKEALSLCAGDDMTLLTSDGTEKQVQFAFLHQDSCGVGFVNLIDGRIHIGRAPFSAIKTSVTATMWEAEKAWRAAKPESTEE